jgi:hypothetical protein
MRRIVAEISPSAQVYPTHGFGSFCSATATVGTASSLADQVAANPVFAVDEETFVAELIAGLDAFPAYYAHMGPANQAGAGAIDLSLPQRATPEEIARRVAACVSGGSSPPTTCAGRCPSTFAATPSPTWAG